MARRSRRRTSPAPRGPFVGRYPPPVRMLAPSSVTLSRRSVLEYSDRRFFHPLDVFRPFQATKIAARRIVAKQMPFRPQLAQTKAVLSFADPSRVGVCVRRKVRREVLHALRKAGKGGMSRPRRNASSSIHC